MEIAGKSIEYVKGQKLLLTLSDDRILEGTFMHENKRREAIILYNVSYVPSTGKPLGQLEIKLNEISKIHCIQQHELVEPNISQSPEASSAGGEIKEIKNLLYEKIKERVSNHVFIDHIDDTFIKAVMDIKNIQSVAVVGQGSNYGRFSQLAILGFASLHTVYLFDMINIGQRAFKASNFALKKILESDQILKIVHNCRFLSDCLKHKYQITLTNVFDTQACHLVVMKYHSRHPPLSAGFSELISEYLKLPSAICESKYSDRDIWCRRPLEEGMAETVAWRVALLRELKPRLDDALYAPFDKLCQFYLTSVRDLDDDYKINSLVGRGEDAVPKEVSSEEIID